MFVYLPQRAMLCGDGGFFFWKEDSLDHVLQLHLQGMKEERKKEK